MSCKTCTNKNKTYMEEPCLRCYENGIYKNYEESVKHE